MIVAHSLPQRPPQSNAPVRAYEIGDNRAPQIEAGLRRRALRRNGKYVRTDFDPTTPGGASAMAA